MIFKKFNTKNLTILYVAAIIFVVVMIVNYLWFMKTESFSDPTVILKGTIVFAVCVMSIFFILLTILLTSLKRAAVKDKELLQYQQKLNEALVEQAEIAKSANRAKSEFLSYISHDIRTPINGIMGMTNIAYKNVDNKNKVHECLEKINDSSEYLLSLVNNLLDMSRIENGKINVENRPMDMEEVINDCVNLMESRLEGRNLNFKCEFGDIDFPYLIGDEVRLRQILINILGNAVKFTNDGGTIVFRVKEIFHSEQRVKYIFEIEDNGIGMSREYLEHIWETFSQEKNSAQALHAGVGLGMAITKKFVDMLNGHISVKSTIGEGSLFKVEIPFYINLNIGEMISNKARSRIKNDITVLLVDDNDLNREIAKELLTDKGINVVCAENGKIACEIFSESKLGTFDAIIMDVMMPVMDGYEATKVIRNSNHPEAKFVPIIAMTANAFEEDVKKTLDYGMNAHLSKPIDMEVLVEMLKKWC